MHAGPRYCDRGSASYSFHVSPSTPGAASSLSSKNASSSSSMLMWWRSEVNFSFFLSFATCRMRSSACDTLSRPCVPARALLARIPLGPRPWLHRLRSGSLRRGLLHSRVFRFVRRLHSYYGGVRLPVPVHHRLRLLAFPMRAARSLDADGQTRDLPGSDAILLRVMCSSTPAGTAMPRITALLMLRSTISTVSAPATMLISWLNHTPHATAVYASCSALPPPHATLATRRPARPYLGRTCTG